MDGFVVTLHLRCAMCDKVRETAWEIEELRDADPEDVCPHCFICSDCLSDEPAPSPEPMIVTPFIS
jgi:hypothetical protein